MSLVTCKNCISENDYSTLMQKCCKAKPTTTKTQWKKISIDTGS